MCGMIEYYLLKNTDIYLYYECPLGVNKKQENIKNEKNYALMNFFSCGTRIKTS